MLQFHACETRTRQPPDGRQPMLPVAQGHEAAQKPGTNASMFCSAGGACRACRLQKRIKKGLILQLAVSKEGFSLPTSFITSTIGFERSVTFLIPKHRRKCAKGRRCSLVFRAALREPMSSVLFCFAHVAHCRQGWLQLP